MDLMGSDALQSEEAMRRMWGDSMKAVKCQNARITYDDFLLLMKGQTKEHPVGRPASPVNNLLDAPHGGESTTVVPSLVASSKLHVVHELDRTEGELGESSAKMIQDAETLESTAPTASKGSPAIPMRPPVSLAVPSDRFETPLSMDDDDDLRRCAGPGIPGNAASLTPPSSPVRSATDYVTPRSGRKTIEFIGQDRSSDLELPGLNLTNTGSYGGRNMIARKRSMSLGEKTDKIDDFHDSDRKIQGTDDLHAVADIVRDMLLPETDHTHRNASEIDDLVKDQSKSALVVNRKLYRAHRQMRLAVLEASKRFEEQQVQHAEEVLMARQQKDVGAVTAGLVMRHGEKKQVSSEAIRKLLSENQAQQQQFLAMATKKGGRGRRSRKKTISDMSGMLTSIGQDELATIEKEASAVEPPPLIAAQSTPITPSDQLETPVKSDGPSRGATVPGEFRSTTDPFSRKGKYGAIANPV